MNVFLSKLLKTLVKTGTLKITGADRQTVTFGDGTGNPIHIQIKSAKAERAIAFDPMLAFPEAYMAQEAEFLDGDVIEFLELIFINFGAAGTLDAAWARVFDGVRFAFRKAQQFNLPGRSKRNVQHHYDLSGELYKLFLDSDMQYSCAYWESPDVTLEEAQLAKKRHLAAKLKLEPGQNVLDIGCGWGGLGLYLARNFDVNVLGVTLSTEQHAVATERARAEGLDNRVHFEIKDYRHINERFDRIVSVGMFEHVGTPHYREFFEKVATLLKPDGVMVLHSIGRFGVPAATAPFIRKYIFPGGYIPALSEVMPHVERAGLMTGDIEILRLHYAETLKHWRQRFLANRDKAKAIYDERFCRMWEFYLAASEASFRWQDMMNFQIQMTKKNDILPMTRSYIEQGEKAIAVHEIGRPLEPAAVSLEEPVAAAPKRQRKVADQ
ncbi:MAG: class I SAM-dependent methyltransferase [Rhizobiaceae bacterium]